MERKGSDVWLEGEKGGIEDKKGLKLFCPKLLFDSHFLEIFIITTINSNYDTPFEELTKGARTAVILTIQEKNINLVEVSVY